MGKREKNRSTKFKTHKFSRFLKSAPFCYAHLIASTVLSGRHVGNINGNVKAIVSINDEKTPVSKRGFMCLCKETMCFYAYIKAKKVTLKSSFIAKFMLLKEAISQSLEY